MRRLSSAWPLLLLVPAAWTLAADRPSYPQTRRDATVETLHGKQVPDPYRWLEEDPRNSKEVAAWIEAENRVTLDYLETIPQREAIRTRLTDIWNYERFSSPFRVAGRYFYFRNDGLQNQSVLFTAERLDTEGTIVIDPNTWSPDGTIALAGLSFSEDGSRLAYARSTAGSDWQEWSIRDMATGQDLPEKLRWVKFTSAAWTKDGRGFFYSRFPEPPPGETFKALNKNQKVYYHRLGTPQEQDTLVWWRPDQPDWGYGCQVSEDGRYLVLSVYKGTDPKNLVLVRDLTDPLAMPVEIITEFKNEYSFLGNEGSLFFFRTDLDAPRRRVIAMDLRRPEPAQWRTILPEAPEPLEGVQLTGNVLIATYLKDVVSRVRIYRLDGTHLRDVTLPGLGSAFGFGGKQSDMETFYAYTSFDTPPSLYHYDLITGESRLWRQAKVAFEQGAYTVRQVFFTSKDGTRIPMFISHRRDLPLDGNRPTLLYGYGGFGISLQPSFSASRIAWMEMGGVLAIPNLRGGGEYGEEWHEAGKRHNKQNVFNDFIAAAEWLIDNRYTRPARLAIQGGSNGGLLVGAAMTQRPDLFGAALPAVGVLDMLRFERFTAGRYWVDDYGSAADPEMFPTLLAYSPYHNLKPGTRYPATLITTADTDDRVIPAHSFKFAAALQKAHAGDAPVLIRVETAAGHGGGKPVSKMIEETADQFSFLVKVLGMEQPAH
jgi:prolyl oligopeptidase